MKLKYYSVLSLCVLGGLLTTPASVWAAQQTEITISSASVLNPSAVEVVFSNQQRMTLDFYGENIFRMFQDNQGGIVRDPQASPEAQILVDRPRKEVGELSLTDKNGGITISTARIQIEMDKRTSLFKITDKIRQKVVVESARPVDFMEKQVCLSLKAHDNEYFYGGGVQNGRFLTKEKASVLSIRTSGQMVEWLLLLLFTGLQKDMGLCGTRSVPDYMISEQLIRK